MAKPMSPFYFLFDQLLVSVDRNKRDGRFFGASCLQVLLANIACNIALKLSNQLVTWLNAS